MLCIFLLNESFYGMNELFIIKEIGNREVGSNRLYDKTLLSVAIIFLYALGIFCILIRLTALEKT